MLGLLRLALSLTLTLPLSLSLPLSLPLALSLPLSLTLSLALLAERLGGLRQCIGTRDLVGGHLG